MMYSKKFLYSSVFNSGFIRPNLNVKSACSDQYMIKCLCTFRTVPIIEISSKMSSFVTKVKILCQNGELLEILSKRLQLSSNKLKDQSTIIIRAWTRQCEYIVAQRFRRTQQMFCLYNRMWEERALRELLKRMQQQVTRRSKDFVFGAIGISAFNWETNKISDEEISKHSTEFEYMDRLKEQTILCRKCHQEKIVDIMLPDKNYCKCSPSDNYTFEDWAPFLERKDLLVWRRKRPNTSNYEYKVYGAYDDVTAEDFLKVQVDIEFRKTWDTTAVSLFVVDTDDSSNSDVIYWEMLWPRMFSNRDYVFNRRYKADTENKVLTIISKSIEHPSCPIKPDKHRIRDYESCMVIKPTSELNRPGIEFCLTYYDDPGVNIPAAVTSWVAIAGMPDFLTKLRKAAKEYRKTKLDTSAKEDDLVIPPSTMPAAEEDSPHQISNTPDSGGYWRYVHPYYYLG